LYHHAAGRVIPEAICRIVGADGSTWEVAAIALAGDRVEWTTTAGVQSSAPWASLARLDFSKGKVVYLSDLEPESVEYTPFFGPAGKWDALRQAYAPREDRGVDSPLLELDGKPYHRGLALRSRTSVVYRLPDRYSRFLAVAGIDDRVRPRGHVRLVIRGDDRVLLDTAIAGTEASKPIDLDLTGVRRLAVLVDYGDDLDVADHLDLVEARIVK